MDIPQQTSIAVVDGETFRLYRTSGQGEQMRLREQETPVTEDRASDSGRSSSAANPAAKQMEEDAFGKGVTEKLNKMVLEGRIERLIIIAAPRSLGEMRRSYHSKLQEVLITEIDKVMTGASPEELQKALLEA